MDDDDGFHNWGYYEPSFKGHLNLYIMPIVTERDTKPFLPGRDPAVMVRRGYHPSQPQPHHHQQQQLTRHAQVHNHPPHTQEFIVSESPLHLQYMRETWVVHQRDKFMSIMPGNPSFGVMPKARGAQPLHMMEQPVVPNTKVAFRALILY
ncbi:unnamed protein product [Rhodiola kirilowii]